MLLAVTVSTRSLGAVWLMWLFAAV
jgi:hypothetical protein